MISSASQYIQNSIAKALGNDQNETYIFSGLPITSDEKDLLRLLNEAIQYSSPAILERYPNYDTDKERLDYLQRYVKTILQMSVEKLALNPVKETSGKNLVQFLEWIMRLPVENFWNDFPDFQAQFKDAIRCLKTTRTSLDAPNNRSNWHKVLRETDTSANRMAEAIVNVAYNYTVEDSIANISKHYDDSSDDDFYQDFTYRFHKYWMECESGTHILCAEEKTAHELYKDWKGMPHWATATRLIADENIIKQLDARENKAKEQTALYETNYQKEKSRWNARTICLLCAQFFIAILISFVIHGFNEASGAVESVVGDWLDAFGIGGDNLTIFITNFLIYTVGFGTIWSLLQMILNLPDIAENLKKLCLSIFDGFVIVTAPRKIAYKRTRQEKKHE